MTEFTQPAVAGVPAVSKLSKKLKRSVSWVNSPRKMGTVVILAAVIGGIAEAVSGLIAMLVRPEKDHSQAYLQVADRFVAQMAADRDDVLQILKRMDERDAETHRALLLRQQIELRVNNMYVNGSSLKEITEAAADAAAGREVGPLPGVRVAPRASVDVPPPRSRPAPAPAPSPAPAPPPSPPPASNLRIFITNGVGGGRAILKTPLTGAEPADLWLRPGETRLIDSDLNVSFGVSADGPADPENGRISVVADGKTSSIVPGEVVRYRGSTGNCFVIYLRAEGPDRDRSRHAFALQCAPERERW